MANNFFLNPSLWKIQAFDICVLVRIFAMKICIAIWYNKRTIFGHQVNFRRDWKRLFFKPNVINFGALVKSHRHRRNALYWKYGVPRLLVWIRDNTKFKTDSTALICSGKMCCHFSYSIWAKNYHVRLQNTHVFSKNLSRLDLSIFFVKWSSQISPRFVQN